MAISRWAHLAVVGALAASHIARADVTAIVGDDNVVHGFVWHGEESLDGRVTDSDGHALRGVQVHIVSERDAEQVIPTDRDGRYHVKLAPNATALVFVHGDVRITSTAATSKTGDGGETVDMHELVIPATPAKLRHRARRPAYSDAASDHNEWLRAWLLLDLDEAGAVTRVKLLDHPGYGLDAIAVRSAFALEFEPARDAASRPMRTQMLWVIDWPAFWWIVDQGESVTAPIPEAALQLPCHDGAPHKIDRSCAPATIANALSAPWITRADAGAK
jgi:hypothetical protein